MYLNFKSTRVIRRLMKAILNATSTNLQGALTCAEVAEVEEYFYQLCSSYCSAYADEQSAKKAQAENPPHTPED